MCLPEVVAETGFRIPRPGAAFREEWEFFYELSKRRGRTAWTGKGLPLQESEIESALNNRGIRDIETREHFAEVARRLDDEWLEVHYAASGERDEGQEQPGG